MPLHSLLQSGLEKQSLLLTDQQQDKLIAFVELLDKWNKVYNLTSVRDKAIMVNRHVLDSLTLLPFVASSHRLLDIGSGGGLPAIPVAICNEDVHCTLLDSNQKKTRFLVQAAQTLGLNNIEVVHSRVQEYHPTQLFDTLTARAFANPAEIMRVAGNHCSIGGQLVLMVGRVDNLDMRASNAFSEVDVQAIQSLGNTTQRHIIRYKKLEE